MNFPDCRNELVQRERRGQLTHAERLALDAHVEGCPSCRMTRTLGHDFDNWHIVDSADAKRLARMMSTSTRWVTRPRRLAKPARTSWMLAAMATTLAAAATTITVSRLSTHSLPSAEGSTTSAIVGQLTQTTQPAPSAIDPARESAPLDVSEPTAAPSSVRGTDEVLVDRALPGVSTATLTAEQLLQRATQARRGGDTKDAARLFRRLQRDYPGSREARLSLVAFGTMLLEQGQAKAALDQFNRYLGSSSVAPLTAEALYGKGRALAQLGQGDEEQRTWRRLVNEYPKSPYASHAKRRLATSE